MSLYKGSEPDKLTKTNLRDEMFNALVIQGYSKNSDSFSDKSGSWIELKKECEEKEIYISISFNYKGSKVTDLRVWETPIKRVLVEDKQKRIL